MTLTSREVILGYACTDIEATVGVLPHQRRLIQAAEPATAVLFGNRRVAFQRVTGLGLIEGVEAGDATTAPAAAPA
jgi:hypothetical protein